MTSESKPIAVVAAETAARTTPSNYPPEFAARMLGRTKHPLGDLFGLRNFGVNMTRLAPGAQSALRHAHSSQDEFVYILEGEATLVMDAGAHVLRAGMCAGFQAGSGDAHHLLNRGECDVVYLEVGARSAGDAASCPDDDLKAILGADGRWHFLHKDGTPY